LVENASFDVFINKKTTIPEGADKVYFRSLQTAYSVLDALDADAQDTFYPQPSRHHKRNVHIASTKSTEGELVT